MRCNDEEKFLDKRPVPGLSPAAQSPLDSLYRVVYAGGTVGDAGAVVDTGGVMHNGKTD